MNNSEQSLDNDLEQSGDAMRRDESSNDKGSSFAFARRVFIAASIAASVVAVGLLLWYSIDILLLVFAGVLLGVLLRGLSRAIATRTKLGHGWSLAIVLITLLIIIGLTVWQLSDSIAAQASELIETLPRAVEQLRARLSAYSWGERVLGEIPPPDKWGELLSSRGGSTLGRITGILSGTLGLLINFLVIVIIGCYIAAEPRLYKRGIIHLIPPAYRKRALEVLNELDTTLGRWLIGRLILMFVNGGLTTLGLWWLDVPLALTLGILAGVLNFIPNFGPFIAGIPAVLIALLVSPQVAVYTAILYFVLQMIDGYVFTPLVDKRSVELPPVLTITAQVLLGVLVGGIGVVLVSPLVASLIVLVRMLYVEDALGDEIVKDK